MKNISESDVIGGALLRIWKIDSMENHAKLCISIDIDDEEPQILIGPEVVKDDKLLEKMFVRVEEVISEYSKVRDFNNN